jgi:hypothetical protein
LTIEFLEGTKGEGDKRVLWNGTQVTFLEIATIVDTLCKNEDIIYPKPRYKGGQMLLDFLQEVYDSGGITDELCKKYRLGDYKP